MILTLNYFECPMLCTEVLNGLISALGVLNFSIGKEFDVVTVSFDPRDTPERASAEEGELPRTVPPRRRRNRDGTS